MNQQTTPEIPEVPSPPPNEICPDGVNLSIQWNKFVIGSSVFVPALNIPKLRKQMQSVAQHWDMKIVGRERIESGKLGMRFWRLS